MVAVGYYRLGQAYPRTRLREPYPRPARVEWIQYPTALVAGPYRAECGQVWQAGAVAGEHFSTGSRAGDVFSTGPAAGQIHG